MPHDIPAILRIRTETQAPLRECIAALSQAQDDPIQAIFQIHFRQAQALVSRTDAPFEACLKALQLSNGDPQQALSYLRSIGYRIPSSHELHRNAEMLIYLSVRGVNKPNWYPVVAEHVHGQCYRVLSENPDPEHIYWEFRTGDIVECQNHVFAEHETGLVAVTRCGHQVET